jgi:hypothetical protein
MIKKPVLSKDIKKLNHYTYFLLKDIVPVIIDKEDFEKISTFCWHLSVRSNGILDVLSTCRELKERYNKSGVYLREFVFGSHGENVCIDHINRNPLDNRKANLRLVPLWCDSVNRAKTVGKSSIYKGVVLTKEERKAKWRAEIKTRSGDSRTECLGYFLTETEAALAFNAATRKYNGEFGDFNVVDQDVCWDIIYDRNQTISELKKRITNIRELTYCKDDKEGDVTNV